jgi:hypothetical protein
MKKLYAFAGALLMATALQAQTVFDIEIDTTLAPVEVKVPASPLKYQVLFIGGHDSVEVTPTYGNPAGRTLAKQWHDFIGFTPADAGSPDYGWVSVNHEMIQANDRIGDGGGMTTFKVRRDPNTDTLIVVPQTLADGRSGKFFNVDFVNTVGETGMNCAGISAPNGRIWTAEEWFISRTADIYANGAGLRDTSDFTIGTTAPAGFPGFNGQTIKGYQNFNWMVEIDPKEAKAIRKQYNWGRQPFEGGTMLPDNKTVFLGGDDTPGFFTKFVANTAGDFTSGKLYVYKHDSPEKWIEIDNTNFTKMLNFKNEAVAVGATMFNRIEWVSYNPADGNVYFTETGRDNPGSAWADEAALGGKYAPHHQLRADQLGITDPGNAAYQDIYGRVIKYDMATGMVSPYIEGGPFYAVSPAPADYPSKHLSNPDGLNFITVGQGTPNARNFMMISEDLNGRNFGRVAAGVPAAVCEVFLLDMSIANPTIDDLVRIAITPLGAEVTGAIVTPDGKTLLINSQHPNTTNPFPYNNSLTFAITGWDALSGTPTSVDPDEEGSGFNVYPNPVSREVFFSEMTDVALYDASGKRMLVARNVKSLDIQALPKGVYYIQNADRQTKKLIIE